jgi:aspartyl/asparaginyl-tRNA synthetase
MAFETHYHEVLGMLEDMFLYIFKGLDERFAKEIAIVRKQYPVEEFKFPEPGKTLRLNFTDGIKMLQEAGKDVPLYEDLRYFT